jgi:hypothetical protein
VSRTTAASVVAFAIVPHARVASTTMAKDVKVFVQNCMHCVATIPGDKVPRPLGTQLHATKPNKILCFEFLYIGLSRDGKYQSLLLLKNDLSGYL